MRIRNNPRILFLLHIPPPIHGSSVVGLYIKKSILINNEFECHYINLLASNNVAESGVVNFKKLLNFSVTWVRIFISLIKNRPSLCYFAITITGAAFFKDLLIVALLKVFRINRIYHLHNKGVHFNKDKNIYRLCYNYVFKNSDVVLLSKRLYPEIQPFVPETKVFICPNGIAEEDLKLKLTGSGQKLQQSSIEQITSLKKTVQILFLSNLFESKGVYILLEACKILKNSNLNFHCTFVGSEGDVSEQQFQHKIQHYNLSGFVNYAGKKYGLDKEAAYVNADIFAFPTFYSNECFPLVLIEAMQHSLPIVTTFEGGIPDIVEDGVTGFLVDQKNVDLLAKKLELLIQDSNMRHQMGAAGRKKYEQEYSLGIFEANLTGILKQVTTLIATI